MMEVSTPSPPLIPRIPVDNGQVLSQMTLITIVLATLTAILLLIMIYMLYTKRHFIFKHISKNTPGDFDIVDYHAGRNKGFCCSKNGNHSDPDHYPSVDFFVPELPVVYQQDPGIGPSSLYLVQTEGAEEDSPAVPGGKLDAFLDAPSTPVFARSSERRKSSLRRLISTTSASDIDLSIYGNEADMEVCGLTTIKSRGRLHLSVVHDISTGCVIVNILSAACLRPVRKMAGKSPPETCLKVSLADSRRRSGRTLCSRIFGGNLDPEYNTSFCLDIGEVGEEEYGGKSEEIEEEKEKAETARRAAVKRKQNRGPRAMDGRELGGGALAASTVDLAVAFSGGGRGDGEEYDGQGEGGGLKLQVVVCAVDRFSRVDEVGRVRVALEEVSLYVGTGCLLDVWRDLIPQHANVTSQGELSVSLCYSPDQKSLSVCGLRARGLVPPAPETPPVFPDIEHGPGVLYVKLTMLRCGSVLKRRRSSTQLHSATPAFNDVHVFDVTPDVVDDVTLVFAVFSRNSRGQRMMVGKMNVGSMTYSTGSGLEHWQYMRKTPGVASLQWHKLF